MFISSDQRPSKDLRPPGSAIKESDWKILSDFWYPVALARDVTDKPVKSRLLDLDLVLFRAEDGSIAAVVDQCPHRHVRLSVGKVVQGQIECAFHGLRFDKAGQCRLVPCHGAERKPPPTYKVHAFPTKIRYGLIWSCIGNPEKSDLPAFPDLDGLPEGQLAIGAPRIWPISAPRQIENFVDLAHLIFIHPTALGGESGKPIAPGVIEELPEGLVLQADYIEKPLGGKARPCRFTYRIVLPFAIDFTVRDEHDHVLKSCDIPSPISAHQSRVFQIVRMSASQAASMSTEQVQAMLDGFDRINQEDIDILSELVLADLPLNQHYEIHLPVDNVCGAYRKRLRGLGLGA